MAEIIPLRQAQRKVRSPNSDVAPDDAVTSIIAVLRLWRFRFLLRRLIRNELLKEPDRVLADAGWIRADAEHEARKPFWRA